MMYNNTSKVIMFKYLVNNMQLTILTMNIHVFKLTLQFLKYLMQHNFNQYNNKMVLLSNQ